MTTAHQAGIDLSYRPESYFWASDRGILLPSDIKGAERRKMYRSALASGNAEQIEPVLSQHALSEGDRQAIGRLHPAFMGGEYLPNARKDEVEIARITIASTTQDVTSIYARRVGERTHYRVIDEYQGETLSEPATRTSSRPLTLLQLVDFFLGAWDLLGCLDANFSHSGYAPEDVKCFVVGAESSFYSQFGELIDVRIDEWLEEVREGLEEYEVEDEEP